MQWFKKRCSTEELNIAAAYSKRVQRVVVTAARHQVEADAATARAGAAQARAEVAVGVADSTRF